MKEQPKKNTGKIIGIGAGVAALAAAGLIAVNSGKVDISSSPNSCAGKPVVDIDANLPLTGNLATYGDAVRDGASMAVEDLKAAGSPNCLNFDWGDNTGDPKTTVSLEQKQFLKAPAIYVSGVKPQTMAIKDAITAKGVPHFVWIFDPKINPNSKNNFRTWVSYKIEPKVYLDYAKKIKAKRVAIAYVQLPHTLEEFNKIVIPGLKAEGISQIATEPFDFGKKDFKDVAAKFKQFNPDLIILNGFQGDLVGLVKALRPLGLIKEGNTIGTYDTIDAAQILSPAELEGIRLVAPKFVTRPQQELVAKWKERFKAKNNREALYTDAFAYDMTQVIDDAAKRLKLPATSEQWIAAIKATNTQGITGSLKFDQDGDLLTPLEVGVFRGGKIVPLDK
jgi:branched-chain amino acid transport system substrate-binding protein